MQKVPYEMPERSEDGTTSNGSGFCCEHAAEVPSKEKCDMEKTTLDVYLERGMSTVRITFRVRVSVVLDKFLVMYM